MLPTGYDILPDQPAEKGEASASSPVVELQGWVIGAIDLADAISKEKPSRSLSMVKTKLEEAELWLTRLSDNGEEVW